MQEKSQSKDRGVLIAIVYCKRCDREIFETNISGINADFLYIDQIALAAEKANLHTRETGHKPFLRIERKK